MGRPGRSAVSQKWAIALPPDEAGTLGPLRCRGEIEVCAQPEAVWLRGPSGDEALELNLRALPGRRFDVLADNQLVAVGATVPLGYCPEGPWIALRKWMTLALPPAALSGTPGGMISLRLERGGPVREANVMLTQADAWRRYAADAPQVRLHALAFAMSDAAYVLVRGAPLPPIAGRRFVEQQGVAIPAGYTWSPALDNKVVRQSLRLETGDLAVVQADGSWDRVRGDDFVRATRSAVRLSTQGAQP